MIVAYSVGSQVQNVFSSGAHAALERLLRYGARPPFAIERLRKTGSALVYRYAKQHSELGGDKLADQRGQRGASADELTLTPLELIDRTSTSG